MPPLMVAATRKNRGYCVSAKTSFLARKSDWEQFRGFLMTFWLASVKIAIDDHGLGEGRIALAESRMATSPSRGSQAAEDQMPAADDAPEKRAGEGRMGRAPSRADNLPMSISAHGVPRPDDQAPCRRGAAAGPCARAEPRDLARGSATASTCEETQQYQPWRVPITLVQRQRKRKRATPGLAARASGR